jgi:hypothetical protein
MANCKELVDEDDNKLEPHQLHILYDELYTTGFTCWSVIEMENTDGRHDEFCPHVGYLPAKKCGCIGNK